MRKNIFLIFFSRYNISMVTLHKKSIVHKYWWLSKEHWRKHLDNGNLLHKTLQNPTFWKAHTTKFESLRPRHVSTQKYTYWCVCCCTVFTNMNYLRNCFKTLFCRSEMPVFNSTENMLGYMICDNLDNLWELHTYNNFGLNRFSNVAISEIMCIKKYFEVKKTCSNHKE